jgi:hypothetical protein
MHDCSFFEVPMYSIFAPKVHGCSFDLEIELEHFKVENAQAA